MRLLSFALFSTLVACTTTPPTTPTRQLAAELEAETVAMVRVNDEGKAAMYCSGVFVSANVIVTAEHCVAFLGMPVERMMLHVLGLDGDMPRWDPVGQEAKFARQEDYARGVYWTGKVIGDDINDDLGAVLIDSPIPGHTFARLSMGGIYAGDKVELVGHPGGYTWSYAEGLVSSVRMHETNARGHEMPTLQIVGPIGPGFSGGGAFDASGNIIGIASYTDSRTNGMGFYIHRDAVRAFLATLKR